MSKGRKVPDQHIDHARELRDRLGRAAYEAATGSEDDSTWETASPTSKELYRRVGQAVMDVIVKRGSGRRGEIGVESIVAADNGKPFVQLSIDLSPAQLTPGKAREIALLLLESAAAAESDAALMAFARDFVGLDEMRSGQMLAQLREQREKARGSAVDSA